jgi:transposase
MRRISSRSSQRRLLTHGRAGLVHLERRVSASLPWIVKDSASVSSSRSTSTSSISGRSPESLGEEYEPSAQAIRNWVAQAARDAGQRNDGLTTEEKQELTRLRRENKALREEPLNH